MLEDMSLRGRMKMGRDVKKRQIDEISRTFLFSAYSQILLNYENALQLGHTVALKSDLFYSVKCIHPV